MVPVLMVASIVGSSAEEPDDVLVLGRVLLGLLRGSAAGERGCRRSSIETAALTAGVSYGKLEFRGKCLRD